MKTKNALPEKTNTTPAKKAILCFSSSLLFFNKDVKSGVFFFSTKKNIKGCKRKSNWNFKGKSPFHPNKEADPNTSVFGIGIKIIMRNEIRFNDVI